MKKLRKLLLGVVASTALFILTPAIAKDATDALFNAPQVVQKIVAVEVIQADEREYGTDTAIYQGASAQKVQASDTFSIAQVGGSVHGRLYDQWTYRSQVSTGIAMGLRSIPISGWKQAEIRCKQQACSITSCLRSKHQKVRLSL